MDKAKKGYCYFDPISQELYVFRHVLFLEHIPFFSISDNTYYVTNSLMILIDHLSISPCILILHVLQVHMHRHTIPLLLLWPHKHRLRLLIQLFLYYLLDILNVFLSLLNYSTLLSFLFFF